MGWDDVTTGGGACHDVIQRVGGTSASPPERDLAQSFVGVQASVPPFLAPGRAGGKPAPAIFRAGGARRFPLSSCAIGHHFVCQDGGGRRPRVGRREPAAHARRRGARDLRGGACAVRERPGRAGVCATGRCGALGLVRMRSRGNSDRSCFPPTCVPGRKDTRARPRMLRGRGEQAQP